MKRLAVLFVFLSGPLFAQQSSISGKIIDSSGAVISGATVQAEKLGGGATTTTRSNDLGDYSVPFINAAEYLLRVDAPGFAQERKQVTVLVGQAVTVDWRLSPQPPPQVFRS